MKGESNAAATAASLTEIVGKDFYRADAVNEGHYSKKRGDVADVDPKVSKKFIPKILQISHFTYLCRSWSHTSLSQASPRERSSSTDSASFLPLSTSKNFFLSL